MEWAYIAGYFDGEGHVGFHRQRNRKQSFICTLSWYNSHLESLQAMHTFMGYGYVRKGNGGGFSGSKKQIYMLSVSSKLSILDAIEHMLPYLLVKREAILELRDHLMANVNEKRHQNYGKLLAIPQEQYEEWYYKEGKSYAQIAKMLGATPSGIARMFRHYNLEARPAGGSHLLGTHASEETKARMKASRKKLWEDPAFRAQQLANLRKGPMGGNAVGWTRRIDPEDGQWATGESHPNAKLTDEKVLALRAAYAAGTPKSILARDYGIHVDTITQIVTRKTWTHLAAVPVNSTQLALAISAPA